MRIPAIIFLLALLGSLTTQAQEAFDRLTFHQAPKALNAEAKTSDWPRFLGPNDDATTPETHLLSEIPEGGPNLVWEVARGESYAGPAIVGDRLVLFHNIDDIDIIECLHPETGQRYWEFTYAHKYRDMFGYGKGPRASPVIADGKVHTLSAMSQMYCLDLETGKKIWHRDLATDYEVPQYFFGHGPNPLVSGDLLYMNIGGPTNVCVAAFHKDTGEMVWETKHEWDASYASPILGSFHGKEQLLVFAGGRSDPAVGGLLLIDPQTGQLADAFPWRSTKVESVNASTPLLLPNNRVLITETYTEGGILLEVSEEMKFSEVWRAGELKIHWSQPQLIDGHIYAFTGRNEPDAGLDCWDATTGKRNWREEYFWKKEMDGRSFGWSFFRGSLLRADGKNFGLGELGTFAIFDLSPEAGKYRNEVDLFSAQQSWTLPAISRGLLYVSQNQRDMINKTETRLLCYDLRAE